MSTIAPTHAQHIGEIFTKSEKILAEKYGVDVKFTLFDRNIFKKDASLMSPTFMKCKIGALGKNGIEQIDIFDFSHILILSSDMLAHDLSLKMIQHLAASKTEGVMIGRHGAKLDLRLVKNCKLVVDEEGNLMFNGCRLIDENFKVIELNDYHSLTLIRAFELGSNIALLDDKSIASNCILNIDLSQKFSLNNNQYYRCSKQSIDDEMSKYFFLELQIIAWRDRTNYITSISFEKSKI